MRSEETHVLLQSARKLRTLLEARGEPVLGRPHVRTLAHQLTTAADRMAAAEDTHSDQLIRLSRFQSERDALARVNYDKLVAARQGLESVYGRGGAELTALSGKTPRVPERLYGQMQQTVQLLERPAVERGEPRVKGFRVDLDEVAADLRSDMPAFRAALDRVDETRKVAQRTLIEKRKTIDALRRVIRGVGQTTEGLFHLSGEDDLAESVHALVRRPLRPSEKAARAAAEKSKHDRTVEAPVNANLDDDEAPAPPESRRLSADIEPITRSEGVPSVDNEENTACAELCPPTSSRTPGVEPFVDRLCSRFHALRGNPVLDALRPAGRLLGGARLVPSADDAERRRVHSHAERGNEISDEVDLR